MVFPASMEMDDPTEPLRIEVPDHAVVRIVFVAMGALAIGVTVHELGPGVWPPNIASPFFLFMILGACAVGGPVIMGGLFGWAATWEVAPGLITIALRNPFRRRVVLLDERTVLGIRTTEREAMEGENTWVVELTTAAERFQTSDFSTKRRADELRQRIEEIFRRKS